MGEVDDKRRYHEIYLCRHSPNKQTTMRQSDSILATQRSTGSVSLFPASQQTSRYVASLLATVDGGVGEVVDEGSRCAQKRASP